MFVPTNEDRALLETLRKKCGVSMADVIRLSLRSFAEQKGIAA